MPHNRRMRSPSDILEALHAMVKASASDHLLGEAVREWLKTNPGAQDGPLANGRSETATPAAPVAPSRSDSPKTEAPSGLQGPAPLPFVASATPTRRPAPFPGLKPLPPAASSSTEIVTFKDAEGKRSSVGIPGPEWNQLLSAFNGNSSAARTAIRQAAAKAPSGVNRSKWTVGELLKQLELQ